MAEMDYDAINAMLMSRISQIEHQIQLAYQDDLMEDSTLENMRLTKTKSMADNSGEMTFPGLDYPDVFSICEEGSVLVPDGNCSHAATGQTKTIEFITDTASAHVNELQLVNADTLLAGVNNQTPYIDVDANGNGELKWRVGSGTLDADGISLNFNTDTKLEINGWKTPGTDTLASLDKFVVRPNGAAAAPKYVTFSQMVSNQSNAKNIIKNINLISTTGIIARHRDLTDRNNDTYSHSRLYFRMGSTYARNRAQSIGRGDTSFIGYTKAIDLTNSRLVNVSNDSVLDWQTRTIKRMWQATDPHPADTTDTACLTLTGGINVGAGVYSQKGTANFAGKFSDGTAVSSPSVELCNPTWGVVVYNQNVNLNDTGAYLAVNSTPVVKKQQPAILDANATSIVIRFNQWLAAARKHGLIAT